MVWDVLFVFFCCSYFLPLKRFFLKNSFMRKTHSLSRTLFVTFITWFKPFLFTSKTDPKAPVFVSGAPKHTRSILAKIRAPAHIRQGSIVTYNVVASNLSFRRYDAACVIAIISACAVGSFRSFIWLCALAITLPLWTMIAPTGTSSASNAFSASFSASDIYMRSILDVRGLAIVYFFLSWAE